MRSKVRFVPPQQQFTAREVWFSVNVTSDATAIERLPDRPDNLTDDTRSALVIYLAPEVPIVICLHWLSPKPPPESQQRNEVLFFVLEKLLGAENVKRLGIAIGHNYGATVSFEGNLQ